MLEYLTPLHSMYNPPFSHPPCTVKTFGLLQPCFGHLSCMPVVCVTHYKLQFESKLKCS